MLAHAKKGLLTEVLALEEEASVKYQILPSVHRLNSVLLAYVKNNEPQKAEHYLNEMRTGQGVLPDTVSYTTLIQGYKAVNNLDKCWELFELCNQKALPGMNVDE